MQYQMSTAPGLAPQPKAPGVPPAVVPGSPKPPRSRQWPVIVLGIVAVAALGWFLWTRQRANQAVAGPGGPFAVRTATVTKGDVVQTIRLTGATGAERFASLLVPQLRGSRADGLREAKEFPSPGANYTVTPNSGSSASGSPSGSSLSSSSSSSSTSSSSSSPSSSGGEGQVASTMGQSTGGSAALRSATSRVGGNRGSSSASTSRLSNSASSSPSSATGDSGLGSTASQLAGTGFAGGGGGGGGGGGRGSDFGLVLQTSAKAGAHVRKNEVVAEFDRQSMVTRLDDYRASVAQMDASFTKLKAEVEVQRKARAQAVENAKAALDQANLDLKTIPVLGAIEAEKVRLAAEEAQAKYKELVAEQKFVEIGYTAQVKEAELELQQAHLELKRAEMNADRMLMKAPIDGLVVMQTMFRSGEMVQIQAGDQLWSGMRFMQIVDPSSMVVNAAVNQVDADRLRIGAKATLHFDAFPDLELPATVQAIGAMTKPGGMRASYVKEIPVILKMDKLDPRVIPDLSVSVDVEIAAEKQATMAPIGSIFHDESGARTAYVFIRNGDFWERRDVEVGLTSNVSAAIRSGLQPGDVIAAERPPEEVRRQGQS